MKFKKSICALATTLLVGANVDKIIPDKFKNYEQKANKIMMEIYNNQGTPFLLRHYDLNGDSRADITEHYLIIKDGDRFLINQYPTVYQFDKNGDGLFSPDENLIDEKSDGLNGNEYWAGKLKGA